ncbi:MULTISPECIES: PAS domain-containing protein [Emticicia]|uniref:PAS domain-containing protein n=1 Tax=Emticicia TaxID=312278 RepID=UPI0007D89957|nr:MULTISPECIES: PAS domain-containing protein [Emticicia]
MEYLGIQARKKSVKVHSPLLSWSIAHPLLSKQLQIAEDIEQLAQLKKQYQWQIDFDFRNLLIENKSLVITNLYQEIIWVSKNFTNLTGYSAEEIVGHKPSMLQGEKTNEKNRKIIREKLTKFENFKSKVLNYRKNGEEYDCQIEIFPIQNRAGDFVHFLAIEKEIC